MNAIFLVICSVLFLAVPAWAAEDGFSLYQQGQYAKAAEAFGKKAMEEPGVPRWRYNRGVSAARAGDEKTAEGALSSSLIREADRDVRFQSAYNLGTLALSAEKYPEAVSYFRKALSEKPGDQDATYNLGLALWRQQKKEEQEKQQQEQQSCKNPQQSKDGKSGENKQD
ncbi:MAG: tetratricopeptide repeat protein, partial [Thermodesulfobacteriota bacterium]